jgi:TetR/AcrR family hemagglutinin/protease transcriptional regulator
VRSSPAERRRAPATPGRRSATRSSARPRAGRLAPVERRRQLLDRAIHVLAARGLARGGHADVAREAGVAVATVFAYFPTREDLVAAVLDDVARAYRELAARSFRDERRAVRCMLDFAVGFAAVVDERRDHACVLLEWSTAVREDVWPRFLAFQEDMRRWIEAAIRRAQAEGDVPDTIDADIASHLLVGSAYIVVQRKLSGWDAAQVYRFLLATQRGAIGPQAVAAALG